MRIKVTFLKAQGGKDSGSVALHHQKILSSFLDELMNELPQSSQSYCFSSLKGTSKVMSGQIRFLSTKISLVITAPEKEFIEGLLKKIFERGTINLGKLSLIPKSYQVISDPKFETVTKYICISPIVVAPPFQGEGSEPFDPNSHEFSDLVFDTIITRMENSGYTDAQLNEYAEFEITPDPVYIEKIQNSPRKYARIYKNKNDESMQGYLFPFSIHAHPEVHKFIWERGFGLFTTEGYGMLDTVPESPAATEPIFP
jgi:CRISPR-associated endoribonuclease Cas6